LYSSHNLHATSTKLVLTIPVGGGKDDQDLLLYLQAYLSQMNRWELADPRQTTPSTAATFARRAVQTRGTPSAKGTVSSEKGRSQVELTQSVGLERVPCDCAHRDESRETQSEVNFFGQMTTSTTLSTVDDLFAQSVLDLGPPESQGLLRVEPAGKVGPRGKLWFAHDAREEQMSVHRQIEAPANFSSGANCIQAAGGQLLLFRRSPVSWSWENENRRKSFAPCQLGDLRDRGFPL